MLKTRMHGGCYDCFMFNMKLHILRDSLFLHAQVKLETSPIAVTMFKNKKEQNMKSFFVVLAA